VDEDWATPYREDYSIVPGFTLHEASGPKLDTMQESEESWHIRETAQFLQPELECTTGRFELVGAVVEGNRGRTRPGSTT
jgi:hypothetical protein